jgi:hypothetical protein
MHVHEGAQFIVIMTWHYALMNSGALLFTLEACNHQLLINSQLWSIIVYPRSMQPPIADQLNCIFKLHFISHEISYNDHKIEDIASLFSLLSDGKI